MANIVCGRCNKTAEVSRADATYCGECKVLHRREYQAERERRLRHPCPGCGREISRQGRICRSCDNRARVGTGRGEANPNWKGGRHLRKRDGYWEVLVDGKRVLEHRYLWEQANGPLPQGWVVHHLNGIKDDNRLENLVGMARSHHGPRAHIDPSVYEARIRDLEARIRELERT